MAKIDRRGFLKASAMLGGGALTPLLPMMMNGIARGQDAPIRAAMSNAGLQASWCAQGADAAMYWGSLLGVEITWFDGELDATAQRARFDQIASTPDDWDFVAVQANQIDALIEPLQILIDAGVPVIGMDTLLAPFDVQQEMGVLSFIAPDNVFMASSVMSVLVSQLGGVGKVARLGGQAGHTGAQARGQGFLNAVAQFPGLEVVDNQLADWDINVAAQITESILNRTPDLNAIYADNDDMALAARQAIENFGPDHDILVVGIDAMPSALEAVQDGRLSATVRNPSCRIHGWSVVAGAYAASVGLEQAREDIPFFILADGPAVTGAIDANPEFAEEPWKLVNYGMSSIPGQLWLQEHFLL
ncbi:MAG: sugar ABC transporter substrate-binding protein [Burkholderiales bacterium]|nr:sugar ABC transporter substrate-binding protein [Anaerolineae bacterium]